MGFHKQTYDFDTIVNDIINHPKFYELKHELHHGISRYEHSLRVAKMTYSVTKKLNLDYERATRAALLHDFYFDNELKNYTTSETFKIHPKFAVINAREYFDIDEKQADMIRTHMFPVCDRIPKYKESYLLGLCDKLVAAHEMYRYKASLVMGIWVIFLFNMITIQK